jgi:hypothetical protein
MTHPTRQGRTASVEARRRRFRAALALEGLTLRAFAESAGVTENHVLLVVKGERESDRVMTLVTALIERAFPSARRRT